MPGAPPASTGGYRMRGPGQNPHSSRPKVVAITETPATDSKALLLATLLDARKQSRRAQLGGSTRGYGRTNGLQLFSDSPPLPFCTEVVRTRTRGVELAWHRGQIRGVGALSAKSLTRNMLEAGLGGPPGQPRTQQLDNSPGGRSGPHWQ